MASLSGIKFSYNLEPKVVRIPLVKILSLIATGTPSRGLAFPFWKAASDFLAMDKAISSVLVTKALILGLTWSIRASSVFVTSTGESFPFL